MSAGRHRAVQYCSRSPPHPPTRRDALDNADGTLLYTLLGDKTQINAMIVHLLAFGGMGEPTQAAKTALGAAVGLHCRDITAGVCSWREAAEAAGLDGVAWLTATALCRLRDAVSPVLATNVVLHLRRGSARLLPNAVRVLRWAALHRGAPRFSPAAAERIARHAVAALFDRGDRVWTDSWRPGGDIVPALDPAVLPAAALEALDELRAWVQGIRAGLERPAPRRGGGGPAQVWGLPVGGGGSGGGGARPPLLASPPPPSHARRPDSTAAGRRRRRARAARAPGAPARR